MAYDKETIFLPREEAEIQEAYGFKYAAKKSQSLMLWYKVIHYNKQGYICVYQPN